MTGERGLDGDGGGVAVANLADHQDFRVLPQNAPEPAGKIELGARPGLSLTDALETLFHGIFNGYDMQPPWPDFTRCRRQDKSLWSCRCHWAR